MGIDSVPRPQPRNRSNNKQDKTKELGLGSWLCSALLGGSTLCSSGTVTLLSTAPLAPDYLVTHASRSRSRLPFQLRANVQRSGYLPTCVEGKDTSPSTIQGDRLIQRRGLHSPDIRDIPMDSGKELR
ncbi:hypothetical protein HRR83_003242 [Exophiala dermatitidis]|uniref:Uncharacterized protein n=1 Tax=Exophiala dermatitidis TaxID=5970 RepID=A0AAN6IV96_EXODE|nr:hypothetical protein HRR74_004601 [Exophiala dermatitidis]KAJ4521204.1 hypothetical protein HRR73_003545 [Exophiala dermatitidis]KAJ4547795.1 hypothetical protein HRR76_000419 [Exophiala dermatitidis]KAJ4553733.1 hypothetical protein HRR77_002108 [Exophiala dermatitidis]KAJ4578061.1 hypothetical protein HRR79_001379 [Exophiala dermatitidis]